MVFSKRADKVSFFEPLIATTLFWNINKSKEYAEKEVNDEEEAGDRALFSARDATYYLLPQESQKPSKITTYIQQQNL